MMKPEISVVIPTRDAGDNFEALLDRLWSQTIPPKEIVIVDSGSRDQTVHVAKRLGAKVLLLPSWRFNHGRARNIGVAATSGDFVVLTVQDALPVDDHWLEHLCLPAIGDEAVAATYGLQIVPSSAPLLARVRGHLWKLSFEQDDQIIQQVASPSAFWSLPSQQRLLVSRFDNVTSCIRRSAWRINPFPERTFAEDLAWSAKVLLRGQKVIWVPKAAVWHYHWRPIWYELRRAFDAGMAFAEILRQPPRIASFKEAALLLRELRCQTLPNRYNHLSLYPPKIKRALFDNEIRRISHLELLYACTPSLEQFRDQTLALIRIHREIIEFVWSLIEQAEALVGGELPTGFWREAAQFATVSVIAQELGAACATHRGLFWKLLTRVIVAYSH